MHGCIDEWQKLMLIQGAWELDEECSTSGAVAASATTACGERGRRDGVP